MLSAQDRCPKFPDGSEGVQGLYLFSLELVIRSARKTGDADFERRVLADMEGGFGISYDAAGNRWRVKQ